MTHDETPVVNLLERIITSLDDARLSDEDLSLDFATCTTPSDRVAVIATAPLTCNEQWTAFASGELLVFQDGQRCA